MNVDHSTAEEFIMHHGIKGMKWGVRRSPQQLGHAVAKKVPSGEKKISKAPATKTPGKAFRKLNMEERYEDLVSRQKARKKTGAEATVKKLLAKNLENLGDQLLGVAVSKIVERIRDGKKLDIEDFKDADVYSMDSDTIAKVSKWYGDAIKINDGRKALAVNRSDLEKTAKKKDEDSKSKANESKPKDTGSSNTPKNSESRLSDTSGSSSNSSRSTKVPWIYSASGAAYKKEAERIARDRKNRDKDILKWLI